MPPRFFSLFNVVDFCVYCNLSGDWEYGTTSLRGYPCTALQVDILAWESRGPILAVSSYLIHKVSPAYHTQVPRYTCPLLCKSTSFPALWVSTMGPLKFARIRSGGIASRGGEESAEVQPPFAGTSPSSSPHHKGELNVSCTAPGAPCSKITHLGGYDDPNGGKSNHLKTLLSRDII